MPLCLEFDIIELNVGNYYIMEVFNSIQAHFETSSTTLFDKFRIGKLYTTQNSL